MHAIYCPLHTNPWYYLRYMFVNYYVQLHALYIIHASPPDKSGRLSTLPVYIILYTLLALGFSLTTKSGQSAFGVPLADRLYPHYTQSFGTPSIHYVREAVPASNLRLPAAGNSEALLSSSCVLLLHNYYSFHKLGCFLYY